MPRRPARPAPLRRHARARLRLRRHPRRHRARLLRPRPRPRPLPYAAEHAARRFPVHTWLVANADRRLTLRDGSIALALSIHGRRNPPELARVLAPCGHALCAVPAADELTELRAALLGESLPVDRSSSLLAELTPHFEPLARGTVRARHTLDRDALVDFLRST